MKRAKFNLSNTHLFSSDMGELIPISWFETLPGDIIRMSSSLLVRLSPLLAPVMHPLQVRIHHFFVPLRLLWVDFEDFITGGPTNADASATPKRTWSGGGAGVGSLGDYLGVPPSINNLITSALPLRAYANIWNNFYRDKDLQTELVFSTASGADTTTSVALQNCCWEKDYFTSSRLTALKGPAITIPLGTTAPVVTTSADVKIKFSTTATSRNIQGNDLADTLRYSGAALPAQENMRFDNPTGLQADLSAATGVSIPTFRDYLAQQRFAEHRSMFGSDYPEYLRFLGIRSSDARLQRPEYLGGGKQVLQISEVLQTATNDDSDPSQGVGTLRGHGISAMRSNSFLKFFEEHGIVMSLMSVRPKTIYGNGLHRSWNRLTRNDYWQKEFEATGAQQVLNKEVYAADTGPNDVFGYQDRYDEYRRGESRVSGNFRDSTLNFWHYARIFGSDVTLNAAFVSCVPTKLPHQDQSSDVLWVMAHNRIGARRIISKSMQPRTL